MNSITIAIDGYSGCGKSSTAKELAKRFNFKYIDSGAMYRGVTFLLLEGKVDLDDSPAVIEALKEINLDFHIVEDGSCHLFQGNRDLNEFLRTMKVNASVSKVSAVEEVRSMLVAQQQKFGEKGAIVMDGRDIGTVVFPNAEVKVFLVADLDIRAVRRQKELLEKGDSVDLQDIIDNFQKRDELDSNREISPLRKAEDAIVIDTSHLTFEDQLGQVAHIVQDTIKQDED